MSFPVNSTPVAPAVPAPLEPGTLIRHLRLLGCAWEDLDGFVYAAEHVDTGQKVTLKEFCPAPLARRTSTRVEPLPGLGSDYSRLLARFIVVTNQMSCLDHPGLMQVKDYWLQDGTVYVEMPWYDSRSLRQELDQCRQEGRPVSPENIAHWLRSAAAALEGLYRSQDMHGGLAPERIQLLADGRVLLSPLSAEWPIRLLLPSPAHTGSVPPLSVQPLVPPQGASSQDPHMALPPWLALEQTGLAHHIRQCGPWSDVYALAAIAASAITGTLPPNVFVRQTHPDIAADYQEDLRLAGLQHDHPAAFMAGLTQALSLHPEQRPRSIAALLSCLGITPAAAPVSSAPTVGTQPVAEVSTALQAPAIPPEPTPAKIAHPVSNVSNTEPSSEGAAAEDIHVFSTFDNTPSVSSTTFGDTLAADSMAATRVSDHHAATLPPSVPLPTPSSLHSPRAQGAAMWGEGPGWSVWLSALVALLTLVYLVPRAYPPGTWEALHKFSAHAAPTDNPATPAAPAASTVVVSPPAPPVTAASFATPKTTAAAIHHDKHEAKNEAKTPPKAAGHDTPSTKAPEKPKDTAKNAAKDSPKHTSDTAAPPSKRTEPPAPATAQARVSQACADALMRQSLDPNAGESRQTPAACQ